jgi:hypothetical protein
MSYVLEWSKAANNFRIQKLELSLSRNRKSYAANEATQYVILHIGSQNECTTAADACRPTLEARKHD